MGRSNRRWSAGAVGAVLMALVLAGCTGTSAATPQRLVLGKDLANRQSSWSWSLVSGTRDADPMVVGLEHRPDRSPTIQAILYRPGDHLLRIPDLPALPGTPHAVRAVARGRGVVIAGATLDESGVPHAFVLDSADRRSWRAVEFSEDLRVVPSAVAADAQATYLAQGRSIWRVTGAGGLSVLSSPALRTDEQIIDLALADGRLWALARGRDGEHGRVASSADGGATWTVPEIIAPNADSWPLTPSGLVAVGSRVLITGQCGEWSEAAHPCLARRDGQGWSQEQPFRGAAGLRLVAPAVNAMGGVLTAATSSRLSEGWPAELSSAGIWSGSRQDLVGDSVGTVLAVGAGVGGSGFLAVVRNAESTRLVVRANAAAAKKDDVELVLGGTAMSSWIRSAGSTWGPRSQFLEVGSTIRTEDSGAYFVSTSSGPISVDNTSVTTAEWRPALGRSRDAFVAETSGDATVIAGSEAPIDRSNLGTVHVYRAGASGDWREAAADLAPRFQNQIATALVGGREWVLATSPPVSQLATESSRMFRSDDGMTWSEVPGPVPEAGATIRINRLCLLPDDGLVAVGPIGASNEMGVWRRQGDAWARMSTPQGQRPTGACASTDTGVVIPGEGPDGALLWHLGDEELEPVETGWTNRVEVHGAVALPGGAAVCGLEDIAGLHVPALRFSRDGRAWTRVQLGAGEGADADAFVTMMQSGNGVLVFSSAPDGLHGWRVRAPW